MNWPTANGKNLWVYGPLGIIFGCTGAHNFYAGNKKMAFTQLALTVCSLGFLALPVGVLAALETAIGCHRDMNKDIGTFKEFMSK